MWRVRFLPALFFILFILSPLDNVSAANRYTLSLTSSGAQSIDVGGNATISADSINVATSCRYGYNLSLQTSVSNNNLYLNGNSANNSSGTYFAPVDGTSSLSSQPNSWGYYYNSSTTPTTSNVFSPVPNSSQTAASVITPRSTAASADISDNFSIHYGVSSSSSLTPGTYRMIPDTNNSNNPGTIVYYLTLAQNCIPYTVTFNPTSTSTGSSVSGTGTMSPQEIYAGEATALSAMSFTPPSGYEFKEWNTAQDGSGTAYQDEEQVTDLAAAGGSITLYAQWYQPPYLYNEVANLVKTSNGSPRTQTLSDMQAVITEPTSTNPATDTSNSGVFLYDAATFGTASDASNDYPIYYYRGIIDSNLINDTSSNGSIGNSAYYPNYVKLDNNTCWRIVRTTGSGGVKMIYNGLYGDSITGSCANSSASATTKTQTPFSTPSAYRQYTGYTYNPNVSGNSWVSIDTVYGTDADYSTTNTADSTIKNYLENTWYANNMTSYTDILEPSAGYCNERVFYGSSGGIVTSVIPNVSYGTGDDYAGPYFRNRRSGNMLTLTCQRQVVDLYTTSSANNGNKQLKYPIALLTADELALAGSGESNNRTPSTISTYSSNYSYRSYLESYGIPAWLMSPTDKKTTMTMSFGLSGASVDSSQTYTRPVISLIHDVYVVSGNGTATKPWIISDEPPDPTPKINLYDAVADQSKGTTQTSSDLQATITTSNSGVYEYNSSFGADSDGTKQDNTKATIYYYRGILDSNLSGTTGNNSYGSNGDGETHPNYVRLNDTCWRIIRTTGSGGVKMIYNGLFSSGTTSNSCANAANNAQISATSNYSGTAGNQTSGRQVARIGYTYNNTYASSTSTNSSTAVNTLFGSDSNYSGNSTSSSLKTAVETWYNNNLTDFTSILEPNAGYCNDRSSFTNTGGTQAASNVYAYTNSTNSNRRTYFGAYSRNAYNTAKYPSLNCSRSTVDRYSTSTASGGNGQLSVPVALITADEASLAGSGRQTANEGSAYNANSYLRTGSNYWTLTPFYRYGSYAYNFYMSDGGYMQNGRVDTVYGIRPVVSLKEGTEATSGSGIATDPWVVEAP